MSISRSTPSAGRGPPASSPACWTTLAFPISSRSSSLKAIRSDLSKIKDAQGDLSGDRRQQVQEATKAFTAQVQSIAGSVVKSTSLSEAKTQLATALQQLGDAYKQSFAKVDC